MVDRDAVGALLGQPDDMLPVPWVEPVDISNPVQWLASDDAAHSG